ncbi:putative ATPase, partial [Lachnellula suecica]
MAQNEEFVHISTGPPPASGNVGGGVAKDFFAHTQGQRWFSEGQTVASIRAAHPHHHLTVNLAYTCDLLAFAAARDDAGYAARDKAEGLVERAFMPPSRRYNDESGGAFGERVVFGAFDYVFRGMEYLVYVVEGSDGVQGKGRYNYILVAPEDEGKGMEIEEKKKAERKTDELLGAVTRWMQELHGEVLVFDQGYWQKNKELYQNIQKANWEDVILDKERKESIIDDVLGFFDGEDRYAEFGVPWKRGIIFYGPPGNGKTISTKALMHDVSKRTNPSIESLYVKTFTSYGGPEYGIRQIFLKARQMAPCLLIFEDIDSLVSPAIRSYFLNEVDGLESNHGILMIGSTNHLERLDPGIAKRPSRFDRKYLFEVPTLEERVQYAEYWRHKLKGNKKVDFPEEMSAQIAALTEDFSFAYMKEAFVAALLVIVARSDKRVVRSRDGDLSENVLFKELVKQIRELRKEMDGE